MSIPELLTLRKTLFSVKEQFFAKMENGRITSGPFESQGIETPYYATLLHDRFVIEHSYDYGHMAFLFSPSILEIALLHAPVYSGQAPFFLLESHQDRTFSGTWLAPHEKDALLTKWEEARKC